MTTIIAHMDLASDAPLPPSEPGQRPRASSASLKWLVRESPHELSAMHEPSAPPSKACRYTRQLAGGYRVSELPNILCSYDSSARSLNPNGTAIPRMIRIFELLQDVAELVAQAVSNSANDWP